MSSSSAAAAAAAVVPAPANVPVHRTRNAAAAIERGTLHTSPHLLPSPAGPRILAGAFAHIVSARPPRDEAEIACGQLKAGAHGVRDRLAPEQVKVFPALGMPVRCAALAVEEDRLCQEKQQIAVMVVQKEEEKEEES